MKISPNAPCPCGQGSKLKRCCGPYLQGRPVPDPETLVRARFTAFATGKVRFIIDTTHPQAPHAREDRAVWRSELLAYCKRFDFEAVTLEGSERAEDPDRAFVRFSVLLRDGGTPAGFRERSELRRDGRRWRYLTGEVEAL